MAIVSSVVSEDRPLKEGGRRALFRATDAQGNHYMQHEHLQANDDAAARLAAWVAAINAKIIRAELNEFMEAVRAGEDITARPVRDVTREQAVRYVFQMLLPSDNPRNVARLLAIRDWLRANYTVSQIRAALGVTSARLTALNNRLDAIAPAKDMILADRPEEL